MIALFGQTGNRTENWSKILEIAKTLLVRGPPIKRLSRELMVLNGQRFFGTRAMPRHRKNGRHTAKTLVIKFDLAGQISSRCVGYTPCSAPLSLRSTDAVRAHQYPRKIRSLARVPLHPRGLDHSIQFLAKACLAFLTKRLRNRLRKEL